MNTSDVVDRLARLAGIEVGALDIYEGVIERTGSLQLRTELTRFRSDHHRHLHALRGAIERLGGAPSDIEGASRERARSPTPSAVVEEARGRIEGALVDLRDTALRANRAYADALSGDLPADVTDLLMNHLEEERRHFAYLEDAIEGRVWERPTTNSAPDS